MNKSLFFIILLLFNLLISGCMASPINNSSQTTHQVQTVSIEEAMTAWQKKEILFIDVRTPGEFKDGHVPNAILIPLSELEIRSNEIPKNKRVYLICRSGNRSAQANLLLQRLGFTQTYSVNSGMNKWNLTIEK